MTTPTRISTETLAGRKFTVDRALFITPRGGCGVRLIRRIDRKLVTRTVFEAERQAAARVPEAA